MGLNNIGGFAEVGSHLLKNKRWIRYSPLFNTLSTDASTSKPARKRSFNQPSLSESLPGLPNAIYSTVKAQEQVTFVTRLQNGLRVASENRFGQFCTVGVIINSGSRFEVAYPSGVSHFLEKLAFQSSSKFKNKAAILKEFEKVGGICDCQCTRDAAIYATSALRSGLDSVMNVIADGLFRPNITDEELADAQQTIAFELESLKSKPEQDLLLMDMIHAAAFRDNTVGLPKLCPEKNLYVIDKSVLFTFLKNHYSPTRMVVAGVGIDHDELVNTVQKYFVDEDPVWEEHPELIKTEKHFLPDDSVAQYTGGIIQEMCDIPQFAGPSGLPELAHVVIGLEGVSYNDEDFIPVCVLNMMMGGGGSFSAGGPGKGIFTRLYLNVLNKYHWIFSATAFNHSYVDSGLFCVHVSATPEHVGSMTEVIVKELTNMTTTVYVEELQRAKKQLQSMLLMNLESKPVIFEDIARQVLANGFRKQPDVYMRIIDRVTHGDIQRVARRLLSSPVSVAARGNIAKLPSYTDIQSALTAHKFDNERSFFSN
ncbi:hypothetical protein V9T40_012522 [Parthenolecanium corni]|uniref:Mitochondrial-processing peptidase subunit alpha n=1 Tax=Parthenolecanium corni TaxID=536013 RepID=A0AAN9T909_9HEMI